MNLTCDPILVVFALALCFVFEKGFRIMSASTNALTSAVSALTVQVAAVAATVADLRSQPKVDPADVAALDKAVVDIQTATVALQAAIG